MGPSMRRLHATVTVLALLALAAPTHASAPVVGDVVIAILDTGIDPFHPEFEAGQIVAWWDFTDERKLPSRTDPFAQGSPIWDTDVPVPFDGYGHGTAVASLAAGMGRGSCGLVPKESHAPGIKLAIAKIGTSAGDLPGDVALAWRWATEVAGADVVSLSASFPQPQVATQTDVSDAIRSARENGTFSLISAGNGLAGIGGLGFPSWSSEFGSTRAAFAVGGGAHDGDTTFSTMRNLDPDVSAWSEDVCVALANGGGYGLKSGTSFSTPLVAGMAASAMAAARANGAASSPEAIEGLLHRCAKDSMAPYAREGWGFLGAEQVPCILANAAAGTTPTYRTWSGLPANENQLYDDEVRERMRAVFSDPRWVDARALLPPIPDAEETGTPMVRTPLLTLTRPGEVGPSQFAGAFEVEAYFVDLEAGERFEATLQGPAATLGLAPDLDLLLYPLAAYENGTLLSGDRLAASTNAADAAENIVWTPLEATRAVLLVVGSVVGTTSGYELATSPAASFAAEGVYAGTSFGVWAST